MESTKKRIEEIKNNGYELDFSDVFNHAFENYKKIALYAGLALFVFLVLMGIIVAGIAVSVMGMAVLNEKFIENLKLENLSGVYIILYLIVAVFFSALLSPFNAGLLKMAYSAEKDEEFHVSTFFEYFKAPYFKELFTATILISLVSSGLSILLELANIQILGLLTSMAVSFLTVLTLPLIIFGELKAIDAIQSSFTIVMKQPVTLILLVVVAYIGSFVGLIGCCIGMFFTVPFIYSTQYTIYCAIVGIDSKTELEEIGSDME
jgi:hypothetical protein